MEGTEGQGLLDVWMASRHARRDASGNRVPFGAPVNLGPPVNSVELDFFASVSFDWPAPGARLYFNRCAPECRSAGIYEATWHPDCNGNLVDDIEDIANGDAADANANDMPDECETIEIPVPFRRGDSNGAGAGRLRIGSDGGRARLRRAWGWGMPVR